MKSLVTEKLNGNDPVNYLAPLDSFYFRVVFGVITHKDKNQKSDNLPLFSKISLMRNMQQLDVRKVSSALTFIEDQSPKKHGHPKYAQITVEIYAAGGEKTEVRPAPGQGFDPSQPIKGCPKLVRESAVGTKFKLSVKKSDDGELSSFHSWPFEPVV